MIQLACPHCGSTHSLDETSAGKRIACHACGKKFKVPGVAPKSTPADSKRQPPADSPPRPAGDVQPLQEKGSEFSSLDSDSSGIDLPTRSKSSDQSEEVNEFLATPDLELDSVFETPADVTPDSVTEELTQDEWQQESPEEDSESDVIASPPLQIDDLESEPEDFEEHSLPDLPSATGQGHSETDQPGRDPRWRDESLSLDVGDEPPRPTAGTDDLRVKCHVCDSATWVKSTKAGKKIVCQDCGTEMTVPEAPTPSANPPFKTHSQPPKKKAGWELAKPTERPKRDLPVGVSLDNPATPAGLHTPKVRKWGETEPKPAEPEDFSEADHATNKSPSDGTVSEEPVGGYVRDEWKEPKQFGLSHWFQDTLAVLRVPSMYGAALLVAFIAGAFGTALKIALHYSGAENGAGMRILGLCGATVSLPTLLLTATAFSAIAMTMIQDAASNARELGNWPEIIPAELFPHCAPMFVAGFVAAAPGMLLAQFMMCVGIGSWGFLVLPALTIFALLPLLIVSVFREQSVFSLYSKPIYESTQTLRGEWVNFYIVCAVGFSVALICLILIGVLPALVDIPAWIGLGMLWVLYTRAIGVLARRLAWGISGAEKDDPSEVTREPK